MRHGSHRQLLVVRTSMLVHGCAFRGTTRSVVSRWDRAALLSSIEPVVDDGPEVNALAFAQGQQRRRWGTLVHPDLQTVARRDRPLDGRGNTVAVRKQAPAGQWAQAGLERSA